MALERVVIPEKIFFKIGEVCDIVGVQPHVLRYWETEFSMLSPQKNKSGQRSYRRRDVEIALRIKQLLYQEMFTIAGARKKLQTEQREGGIKKAWVLEPEVPEAAPVPEPDPVPATPAPVKTPAPVRQVRSTNISDAPTLFGDIFPQTSPEPVRAEPPKPAVKAPAVAVAVNDGQRDVIKAVAGHLLEIRELLKKNHF